MVRKGTGTRCHRRRKRRRRMRMRRLREWMYGEERRILAGFHLVDRNNGGVDTGIYVEDFPNRQLFQ